MTERLTYTPWQVHDLLPYALSPTFDGQGPKSDEARVTGGGDKDTDGFMCQVFDVRIAMGKCQGWFGHESMCRNIAAWLNGVRNVG